MVVARDDGRRGHRDQGDDVVGSCTIRAGVVSTGSLEYKDRCERRSRGRARSSAIARGRRTARTRRARASLDRGVLRQKGSKRAPMTQEVGFLRPSGGGDPFSVQFLESFLGIFFGLARSPHSEDL